MIEHQTTGLVLSLEEDHQLSIPYQEVADGEFEKQFEILSKLGSGATCTVSKVRDRETGEIFAAKTIEIDRDNLIRNLRIESEFTMLDRMKHPNILRLVRVLKDTQNFHVVSELADLGDLFSYVTSQKNGYMLENDFLPLFSQCVAAIYFLHSKGMAHRDIKPQNFLLKSRGNDIPLVLLADFGLATYQRELITSRCGTLAFASPEVLTGKYSGPEVDAWALGVMAYYCMTAELPFFSPNQREMAALICRGQLEFPKAPSLSSEARRMITGLLEKNSSSRSDMKAILSRRWVTRHALDGIRIRRVSKSSHSVGTALDDVLKAEGHHAFMPESGELEKPLQIYVFHHYKTYSVTSQSMYITWNSVHEALESYFNLKLVLRLLSSDANTANSTWVEPPMRGVIQNGRPLAVYAADDVGISHLLEYIWYDPDPLVVCDSSMKVLFINYASHDLMLDATFGFSLTKLLKIPKGLINDTLGPSARGTFESQLNASSVKIPGMRLVQWRALSTFKRRKRLFLLRLLPVPKTSVTLVDRDEEKKKKKAFRSRTTSGILRRSSMSKTSNISLTEGRTGRLSDTNSNNPELESRESTSDHDSSRETSSKTSTTEDPLKGHKFSGVFQSSSGIIPDFDEMFDSPMITPLRSLNMVMDKNGVVLAAPGFERLCGMPLFPCMNAEDRINLKKWLNCSDIQSTPSISVACNIFLEENDAASIVTLELRRAALESKVKGIIIIATGECPQIL